VRLLHRTMLAAGDRLVDPRAPPCTPSTPHAHPSPSQVETAAAAAAARKEFDHENFEWSRELSRTLERVFGHRQFRQNQRAVVNATMSRRDVFVIMPTGNPSPGPSPNPDPNPNLTLTLTLTRWRQVALLPAASDARGRTHRG